jgi:hypothetical protein
MTYTFRSTEPDGTVREVEITGEQALDLGAGQPIAYFPRDERVPVDEHGRIIRRERAIPQQP